MGAEICMRSNLFLPLGKVRMGLRLGGAVVDMLSNNSDTARKGSAPALANPNKSNPRIISSIISKKDP